MSHFISVPDNWHARWKTMTDAEKANFSKRLSEHSCMQTQVAYWAIAMLDRDWLMDTEARCRHFLEEAVELVQAVGLPQYKATAILAHVYRKPVGDPVQEVGGVHTTLMALCSATNINANAAFKAELARVWLHMDTIYERVIAKSTFDQEPVAAPRLGTLWLHRNKKEVYEVTDILNGSSADQGAYPTTVAYKGQNGLKWCRPLSDWHRSMEPYYAITTDSV